MKCAHEQHEQHVLRSDVEIGQALLLEYGGYGGRRRLKHCKNDCWGYIAPLLGQKKSTGAL